MAKFKKQRFSVTKEANGRWATIDVSTRKSVKTYRTKYEAVAEARKIAREGATVIVHGAEGDIKQVLSSGVGLDFSSSIKEARVKHRRSNQDVNIAIAKALESVEA